MEKKIAITSPLSTEEPARSLSDAIAVLAGASIRQTVRDQLIGDARADLLAAAGGAITGALCIHIYRLMIRGR